MGACEYGPAVGVSRSSRPVNGSSYVRQLPPLQSLRAFEAAARHGSFLKASRELDVTQSAISHQVRTLEEHLGLPVFRRFHNGIELTQQGEELLEVATPLFDSVARKIAEIRGSRPSLSVSCSPSFALRWLLRRIGEFERAYPEIVVSLSCGSPFPPGGSRIFDIEIVYRMDPPTEAVPDTPLLDEWMMPVCAPGFLRTSRIAPRDVIDHKLLVNNPDRRDWQRWAAFAGVDPGRMEEALSMGTVFDTDTAAIEMALCGGGIALANINYICAELDGGVLVPALMIQPFRLGTHYLRLRETASPSARTFSRWIADRATSALEEIGRTQGLQ